jgi:predicted nucleic acid-binding protein
LTRFVLDCSVAVAWCFDDEQLAYADAILDRLRDGEASVPVVWPLELANALLVGERRRRLSKADTARFLALIQGLHITVDEQSQARAFDEILSLAREHRLSSYDAAYLELAMRNKCALATLDAELRRAAIETGVAVLS